MPHRADAPPTVLPIPRDELDLDLLLLGGQGHTRILPAERDQLGAAFVREGRGRHQREQHRGAECGNEKTGEAWDHGLFPSASGYWAEHLMSLGSSTLCGLCFRT